MDIKLDILPDGRYSGDGDLRSTEMEALLNMRHSACSVESLASSNMKHSSALTPDACVQAANSIENRALFYYCLGTSFRLNN